MSFAQKQSDPGRVKGGLDMKRTRGLFLVGVAGYAMVGCLGSEGEEPISSVEQSVIAKKFGTHCTDEYEVDWQDALPGAYTTCSRFNAELDNAATKSFYYNLEGAQAFFHESDDQRRIEKVDLFFLLTHGDAIDANNAAWAMWDDGALAKTSSMRLGDEDIGLSIFAQDSCETLLFDANLWKRWDSVFKGGLRMSVGSHGTLHLNPSDYDVGKVFAQQLNAGQTITDAWYIASDATAQNNQDVAVMATGTSAANCESRMGNMTWNNFMNYPRLRDGAITHYCSWNWDDV